jgi:hypothetical protein
MPQTSLDRWIRNTGRLNRFLVTRHKDAGEQSSCFLDKPLVADCEEENEEDYENGYDEDSDHHENRYGDEHSDLYGDFTFSAKAPQSRPQHTTGSTVSTAAYSNRLRRNIPQSKRSLHIPAEINYFSTCTR